MSRFQRAVFLDRDGVINVERSDYVKTIDELEIHPDFAESIKLLKNDGFLVVVVSNQSAVNRGIMTRNDVEKIHSFIQQYLKKHGTYLDGFYYCPHRPDENCDCRKPNPGLILKATDELNIDLKSSWMIGDKYSDIEAGKLAGCKTMKLDVNLSLKKAVQNVLQQDQS